MTLNLSFSQLIQMAVILIFTAFTLPVMAKSTQEENKNLAIMELIDQARINEQEIRNLRGELEVIKNDVSQLTRQLETLKAGALNNSTPQSSTSALKEELNKAQFTEASNTHAKDSKTENHIANDLFNAAHSAFEQSAYSESKEAFETFIKTFNTSSKVFDARLYLVKIAVAQDQIKPAIAHLHSIVVNAPKTHPLLPEVLYLLVQLYRQTHDVDNETLFIERLINDYPASEEAKTINQDNKLRQ